MHRLVVVCTLAGLLSCTSDAAPFGGQSESSGSGDDAAGSGNSIDGTGTDASTTASPDDAADTSTSPDSGTSAVGDDAPLLDVGSDRPPLGCDSDVADHIYLLDIDVGLHRLAPATLTLESLGTLDCQEAYLAAALTIDRSGTLWSVTVDEQGFRNIHTIDPSTLECELTDFVEPVADDIHIHGLAFVADAPDAETETLYAGITVGDPFDFGVPMSVGKIDLATMDVEVVGTTELVPTGYYQAADLTGTGDARMFGFYPGDTAAIVEIDETNAELLASDVLEVGAGSPWAFAQWAGSLWLFTPGAPGSQIRAYDPATGAIDAIDPGIGIVVVGAAVSTCAPYRPQG